MAVYQLYINNSLVLRSPEPGADPSPHAGDDAVSMVSFERNYDGAARLLLQWHGRWQSAPFVADALVELLRDDALVFSGLLDLPRPVASTRQYPYVEYAAYDLRRALSNPTAMDANGGASIALPAGTVGSAVTAYLDLVGTALDDYGVDTVVQNIGGAGNIQTLPVSLEAASIDAGFRQIAAAAPGVRVTLIPPPERGGKPRYALVNLWGCPDHNVIVDERRVPEISIPRSIEGCAGAVLVLEGATWGSADVTLDQQVALTPAWDELLEDRWTFKHAFTHDDDGEAETELSMLYRLWSYAGAGQVIRRGMPLSAMAEIIPDDTNPQWQRISIVKVDYEAQTVLLNLPAVQSLKARRLNMLNVNEPGRAKKASTRLRWSNSTTAWARIIINSARFPTEGYAGTAYGLAPITCGFERVVQVPGGVSIEEYVRDAHAAFSEPTASGSIPLEEDLPSDLWNLGRRINVATASHGQTGYESLRAPLMGVQVSFAGGATASLELSSDHADMLREGA